MVPSSRPSFTVLIVEDEILISVMLSDLFEDAGFTVLDAATAADGMSILLNQGQCINLLLTDVRMPGDADGSWCGR